MPDPFRFLLKWGPNHCFPKHVWRISVHRSDRTWQRLPPPVQQLTMYESASCSSTPGHSVNHLDLDDQQHTSSALSLELAGVDMSSLQHHQNAVVNSTTTTVTAQSGVHGRGGMDLSMTAAGQHHHHDQYTVSSSTSSSAAAASTGSLAKHQHPVSGESDSRTLQEQLEYVSDLHFNGPFSGTNIDLTS